MEPHTLIYHKGLGRKLNVGKRCHQEVKKKKNCALCIFCKQLQKNQKAIPNNHKINGKYSEPTPGILIVN